VRVTLHGSRPLTRAGECFSTASPAAKERDCARPTDAQHVNQRVTCHPARALAPPCSVRFPIARAWRWLQSAASVTACRTRFRQLLRVGIVQRGADVRGVNLNERTRKRQPTFLQYAANDSRSATVTAGNRSSAFGSASLMCWQPVGTIMPIPSVSCSGCVHEIGPDPAENTRDDVLYYLFHASLPSNSLACIGSSFVNAMGRP